MCIWTLSIYLNADLNTDQIFNIDEVLFKTSYKALIDNTKWVSELTF